MSVRFSRRELLRTGTAVLAAMSLPSAAYADPAMDEHPTSSAADAVNLLTINATIAGQGPYRFVVDTGADRTVIADDVAQALHLPRGSRASVVGVARTIEADTARLSRFDLGHASIDDLLVPVLPRAWLRADGYLGLDVIDGHRITFDFRKHLLTLNDPRPSYFQDLYRMNEVVLRAGGSQGRLRSIDCRVDGVPTIAFLDTGADVSVGNSRLLAALEEGHGHLAGDAVTLTGITGGTVFGRTIAVDRARFGGFDLSTDQLVIADLPIFDLWGLSQTPTLFIGMDFLNRFAKVTIDFGRKEYRLELASIALAQRL